jgi:hypothetical protein
MPDPTQTTATATDAITAAAAGATGASTAAATTTTVAAPAAPQRPKAGKPRQQVQQPAKRKGIIEIPENAFKQRVQREAAMLIRQQTGVTMEEAVRLIKAGGTVGAGGGQSAAANTADAALAQHQAEINKLRRQNERLTRESGEKVRKLEKQVKRAEDARQEAQIQAEARIAGITDPVYVDVALARFAKAVLADHTLQPDAFFADLKTKAPALFAAPVAAAAATTAQPTRVAATTAPPESQAAGGVVPAARPAGSPPEEFDAEKASEQDFHARQRFYGFVPGMA